MIIALQTLIFFRESLVAVLDRLIGPYYKRFSFSLKNNTGNLDEDDSDEEVFASFDNEKGVVFFPPMYAQRYAAVNDCLLDERWYGKLEKIVDLGYHDMSFIKYLKEVPGVKHILGVDIDTVPLRCSSDLITHGDYIPKRENPLQITLFQGNAADPDYHLIGCDAVVAIEMIEHMLPHDLDRLIHNIFGFIQPHIAVITTPNSDFNILFKAMEKNGLRRWDHFFEWTREQFYDWCSNIVVRYPNYTVTCKGIGPGPPGTSHVGCCSQLALFISKDYHKQQDLTIDSLALVKNLQNNINNLSYMERSWDCVDDISESNMICGPSNPGSDLFYTEKQSYMTLFVTPFYPLYIPEYKDNTIQCNIDKEVGRSYLMFDEDVSANVLEPRRQIINRIYDMEDVNNRLNCSTIQVKKFSKITQNLIAKNKADSIAYTKEVVDDIQQLTKMLNFDKNSVDNRQNTCIWRNINWGDDAPYWNQYYKVVRDYNYPFETKSDECRIMDLISDEINRIIDSQCTDEGEINMEKVEIPLNYLMGLVEHITDDKHKVKDLLEWNGYKVVNDIVIHSRLVVENLSMATPEIEWQDDDAVSDWGATEVHSTSYSNRSISSSQLVGKGLRSALEYKVRKLRALLNADEDVTTELDRVVCRLMKLALRTSRDRDTPPPSTWLQYKLLDLLTLTERAIERRKRHYFDNNPFTIQLTDFQGKQEIYKLSQAEEDSDTMKEIVDKYCHFIGPTERTVNIEESNLHVNIEDDLSVTSNELVKIFDHNNETSSSASRLDRTKSFKTRSRERKSAIRLHRKFDNYSGVSSSGDTDHSAKVSRRNTPKKANKKHKGTTNNDSHRINVGKAKSKRLNYRDNKMNEKYGGRDDKKRFFKKIVGTKNLYSYLLNNNISSVDYEHYKVGIEKRNGQNRLLRPFSKPIPNNSNLCQEEVKTEVPLNALNFDFIKCENNLILHNQESIALTEESCVLEIVTDGMNETIALCRTIATDAYDSSFDKNEQSPSSHETLVEKDLLEPENMDSKHIFLFDSEPSTSKGIRHVKMDVQCGSDAVLSPVLSSTMSLHRIPGIITQEFNDGYTSNDIPCKQYLGHSNPIGRETTIEDEVLNYRLKSNGIQIKDSPTKISQINESGSTGMHPNENFKKVVNLSSNNDVTETVEPRNICNVMEKNKSRFEFVKSSNCDEHNVSLSVLKSIDKTNDISGDVMPWQCNENKDNKLKNYISASKRSLKSELTCGGVIIHSYRDRRACEDILYQGKWQRSALTIIHKNPRRTITIKKNPQQTASKIKNYNKKSLVQKSTEKIHVTSQNYLRFKRKIENEKLKGQNFFSHIINKPVQSSTPIKKTDKKIFKAVSKITSKSSRTSFETAKHKHTTLNEVDKTLISEKPSKENKITANLRKDFTPQSILSRKRQSMLKSLEKIVEPYLGMNRTVITKNNLVTTSKEKNVKKELTKYVCDAPHITFSVFRNKIEQKKGSDLGGSTEKELINNDTNITLSDFQCANSSCSSNNSIATIRQLSPLNRESRTKENFTSSKGTLNSTNAIESLSVSKSNKSCKKSTVTLYDKENNLKVSKSYITLAKDGSQNPIKNVLTPRNDYFNDKNIVSNVGNETHCKDIAKNICLSSVSLSDKKHFLDSMPIHKVLILEHNKTQPPIESAPTSELSREENLGIISKIDSLVVKSTDGRNIENASVNLFDQMLTIVEELIDFIQFKSNTKSPYSHFDRNTVQEDCSKTSEKPSLKKPVVEDSTASSFGSGSKPVHVDLISFKSFASISGYSEYFLADNELNSTFDSLQIITPPNGSLHDIFERKDQLLIPNSEGLMDAHSYSGFSINEQTKGDQPDYVNLIDSETGSLAHCLEVRRATSEEVFTSGRSSDTYVSCQVEDNTLVPNWLFRNVNQHSEEEPPISVPLPAVSPQLDVSENISDIGIGVGAGAGDGRGIHSDQHSSGRDTSMSSTETSSGQYSEALLTEPSAFTGNIEFLESSRPFLQIPSAGLPNASYQTVEGSENDVVYNVSEGSNRNAINHETIPSDRDADVSSLDTDIADFSDN